MGVGSWEWKKEGEEQGLTAHLWAVGEASREWTSGALASTMPKQVTSSSERWPKGASWCGHLMHLRKPVQTRTWHSLG